MWLMAYTRALVTNGIPSMPERFVFIRARGFADTAHERADELGYIMLIIASPFSRLGQGGERLPHQRATMRWH